MTDNPYASPKFTTANHVGRPRAPSERLPIASRGRRFVNFLIDYLLTQVIAGAAGFLLGVIYGVILVILLFRPHGLLGERTREDVAA